MPESQDNQPGHESLSDERFKFACQQIIAICQRGGFRMTESAKQAKERQQASRIVASVMPGQIVNGLDLLMRLGMCEEEAKAALDSNVDIAI